MAKRGRRRNGEGTVYQRKDGRWVAEIRLDGIRQPALYAKTEHEAFERLYALQARHRAGEALVSSSITVEKYLQQWLRDTAGPRVRASSLVSYRTACKHVARSCGGVRLCDLKPGHVQHALADAAARGLGATSLHHIHRVLTLALNDAIKLGLLRNSPMPRVTAPRIAHREMQTLSMDQALQLFHAVEGSPLEAFLVLLTLTGLRFGEAAALRWEDIDFSRRVITVRRALHRAGGGIHFAEPKTRTSRRTVFFGQRVSDVLSRQWQQAQRITSPLYPELVFHSTQGMPLHTSEVGAALKRLLASVGLAPMRVHDLRHTAATLMLEQGVHPKMVQEMLGHSSIAMTMDLYSHATSSMHKHAVDQLDAALDTLANMSNIPKCLSESPSNHGRMA